MTVRLFFVGEGLTIRAAPNQHETQTLPQFGPGLPVKPGTRRINVTPCESAIPAAVGQISREAG
jgi:hypothetical protein